MELCPALWQRDPTRTPALGFTRPDPDTRESVEAARQEAPQVRCEGARDGLLGENCGRVLGRQRKGIDHEVGVAALEELERTLPVAEASCVDTEQCGEHGGADVLVREAQVELERRAFHLCAALKREREQPGGSLRRLALLLARPVQVVVADDAVPVDPQENRAREVLPARVGHVSERLG